MEWQGAISGAIAALGGKILFDWLRQPHRGTANGRTDYRTMRKDLDDIQRADLVRRIVREELDTIIRTEFDRDPRRRRIE